METLINREVKNGIHTGRVKVGWEAPLPQRKSNRLVHTLHDKIAKESLHIASQGLRRLLWMVDHPYNQYKATRGIQKLMHINK